MKKLSVAILIAAAFAAGCGTTPPKRDPSAFFRVDAEEIDTVGGGTNYAAVMIHPAKDKRWNNDFAAAARITGATGLKPESMTFDRTSFVVKDGYTRLNVPVATSEPGDFKVEMALNFSICDNLGCETFENVPVTVPFKVSKSGAVPPPPDSTENADLSFDVIRNPTAQPAPELVQPAPNLPGVPGGDQLPQAPQPAENPVK